MQLTADKTNRKIATQKNDSQILAKTNEERIGKDTCFNTSCYRVYTMPTNEKLPTHTSNYNTDNEFFNVWKHLSNIFDILKSGSSKQFRAWLKLHQRKRI